ncbi:MAG: hypothetical protein CL484_12700 [Acidobacteria bacterium]|nr:hypothetical protein [Acidobacteriota bacterium]|tara:strand:- start:9142 stop:10347 length:1206 start_codon:yes stop_codon:yes gene_type:complete
MEFRCRIATKSGRVFEETYVSESEAALRQKLKAKGLHLLSLRRPGVFVAPGTFFRRFKKLSNREFLIFNQELATLLGAGLPLVQSLHILRQRSEESPLKALLDDVHSRVQGGAELSEAFSAHGNLIHGVYTASLLAGERSGGLEEVLRRYVAYVKVIETLRQKSISALVYPAVLLVLSMAVVGIIVLRVVPEFEGFYQGFGAELPLVTQLIIKASEFIRSNVLLTLLGFIGVPAAGWYWLRSPKRRVVLDGWLLKVPGVGPISSRFTTSQLSRTLAILLKGGIPLVDAIEVSSQAIGNRYYARELLLVGQRVKEGQAFSGALLERRIVPSVAVKMVEVGESTGALQEMLSSVADFYDEEIETRLGRFITLIEPALLVIMGLIIATLLIALYLPLLQLGSVL